MYTYFKVKNKTIKQTKTNKIEDVTYIFMA